MSAKNNLIPKISDYLENRQKTNNFGTCKKCSKNVYWSTTKVASHIRSGHCKGESEEVVQKFKQEYVYETPKHLIHKSLLGKTPQSQEEPLKSEPKEESGNFRTFIVKKTESSTRPIKRQKIEFKNDDTETGQYQIIDGSQGSNEAIYELETTTNEEHMEEILFVTNETEREPLPSKTEFIEHEPTNKEEKFIAVVHPQFKGRTKLQLIDDIIDLQRRNELLQKKVKTYEDTINKLL